MARKYIKTRQEARQLRKEGASIDSICTKFGLSKGTVWPWIKDMPLARNRVKNNIEENRQKATRAYKEKCKKLRQEAKENAAHEYIQHSKDITFRDFVCTYLGEGTRKGKHHVAVVNSNPNIVKLSSRWISKLTKNKILYDLRIYDDLCEQSVKEYWSKQLGISLSQINVLKKVGGTKTNNKLKYGTMTVRVTDTYLKIKLHEWMNELQKEWHL